MKIYVHYLARTVTEDDVREAFTAYGEINAVGLLRVPPNDDPLGVGYVEMIQEHDMAAAIGAIEQIRIGGFPIRLDEPRSHAGRRTGGERRAMSNTRGPDRRATGRRSIPRLAA